MPNIRNTTLSTGQTLYHKSLFDIVFPDENEDITLKDILDDIDVSIANIDAQINLIKTNNQTSENKLNNHITDLNNPHHVTKLQVGLGNADNTADANKNVATARHIKDSADNTTNLDISVNKPSLTVFDSIAIWSGKELRSASFASIANSIKAVTVKSDGNYNGLVLPNSNDTDYIRTTRNGLLPYASGGNGSIGTSGWPFSTIYGNTLYEGGTSLSDKYLGKTANAASATKLQTARKINGTSFDGSSDITTSKWGTARTITIGSKGKSIDGSANVSFTLAEIGAAASGHTHDPQTSVTGNAGTATKLQTARKINGTSFDGSTDITTTKWGTARTLTIGSKGKSIDGSGNVSFTLAEIGAAATTHTHDPQTSVTGNAGTATKLQTARKINGTSFDGSSDITTSKWGTARTITIGSKGKSIDGSANVSFTLSEIGAAASNHSHSYLPLAGGTMDAGKQIQRAGNSVSWVAGRSGALLRQNSYTGYNPLLSMKTTNGTWDIGVYSENRLHFSYITDANFNAGTNTQTVNMYIGADGNLVVPKVTASSGFIGNASTASKLQTARNITIGNKTKSFDGSGNISFSLDEIGVGGDIPEGLKTGYVLTGLRAEVTAGTRSTAEGQANQVGDLAHAEGSYNQAYGNSAHAEGNFTRASGINSHAEGETTTASGKDSHAEGYYSTAGHFYSHAEGEHTTANGKGAHSEGYCTEANGNYSHAEGYYTEANGNYSHAEGYYTKADGTYSHASGNQTVASKHNQTVFGSWNTRNNSGVVDTDRIFIIGNGTGNASYSNAISISSTGTTYGKGAFQTSGADYAEYYEWLDGNIDNEDRRGYFVTLEDNKIRIANSNDEYILGIVSSKPVVVGNCDTDEWIGKFLKDEFGSYIMEEIEQDIVIGIEKVKETYTDENGNEQIKIIPKEITKKEKVMSYVLNPNYDPSKEFIGRDDRPEWSPIGMLGVLVVRDDGTCKVNRYCKVADSGIATHSDNRNDYRVIQRVNDHLIKVIFR